MYLSFFKKALYVLAFVPLMSSLEARIDSSDIGIVARGGEERRGGYDNRGQSGQNHSEDQRNYHPEEQRAVEERGFEQGAEAGSSLNQGGSPVIVLPPDQNPPQNPPN